MWICRLCGGGRPVSAHLLHWPHVGMHTWHREPPPHTHTHTPRAGACKGVQGCQSRARKAKIWKNRRGTEGRKEGRDVQGGVGGSIQVCSQDPTLRHLAPSPPLLHRSCLSHHVMLFVACALHGAFLLYILLLRCAWAAPNLSNVSRGTDAGESTALSTRLKCSKFVPVEIRPKSIASLSVVDCFAKPHLCPQLRAPPTLPGSRLLVC